MTGSLKTDSSEQVSGNGCWSIGTSLVIALLLASPILLTACTAVVTPPEEPDQPETVYLVDATYHAALVLPVNDRGWVRYEFGDWSYFGLNHTGFFSGFAAYAWPTSGALGRRFGNGEPEDDRKSDLLAGSHVYELEVSETKVRALRNELNQPFEANDQDHYDNRLRDLNMVRVDWGYWAFHDSNAQVVDWLQQLDCEVHGSSYLSNWRVVRE